VAQRRRMKIVGAGLAPALKPGDREGRPYAKTLFSRETDSAGGVITIMKISFWRLATDDYFLKEVLPCTY